jgi:AcrR family transcriptional regulator
MRITAEEKSATRQRILDSAIQAFRTRGFEATTTRDIATTAGIATGTLFNYFATKEAIVEALAAEALASARSRFDGDERGDNLEEALFAYVVAELRQLKPLRRFITPLLETSLCPLAVARRSDANNVMRVEHMETVADLTRKHGFPNLSPVNLHVYWTLYIGVLTFWAADNSPKQEDTLALLDQSITMYVGWLRGEHKKSPS